jgi:hypothetical protein
MKLRVVAHPNPLFGFEIHKGRKVIATGIKDEALARKMAAGPELFAAGEAVLSHLKARIRQASEAGGLIPVYNGVGHLHTAIQRAKGGDR